MPAFVHLPGLLLASLGWSASALNSHRTQQAAPSSGNHFNDDYAVATVVCNDTWVPGALALGASLVNTGTKADRVLLISYDISENYRRLATMVFNKVIRMKFVEPHPAVTRTGAHCLTLQLRTWQLPYKKVLYMDADMIAIKNQDWMFESFEEFSATADMGMSKAFNGGMFLLQPSEKTFDKLESFLQKKPARESPKYWQTGMQYFLNEAFPRCDEPWAVEKGPGIGCWWQHMGIEHNVFARYITHDLASALLNRSPDNNISSVHYAGDWNEERKPWMTGCQEAGLSLGRSDTDTHRMLLSLWKREFQSLKNLVNPQSAGSWFMNLWLPGGSADRLPKINCPTEKRLDVTGSQKAAAASTAAPVNFWQKPIPGGQQKAAATTAAPVNLWQKRAPTGQQKATAAPVASWPLWGSAGQKLLASAATAAPPAPKTGAQATPAPAAQLPAKVQSKPPMAPWWQKSPTTAAPEPEADTSSSWAVLKYGQ